MSAHEHDGPPIDLGRLGRLRTLAADHVLFRETDTSSDVYIVVSGRIRLVASAGGGREVVLDVKHAGDVFGDLSAIDGRGRSASAVAAEPSQVAEMTGETYLSAVLADPRLARQAMRSVAQQVRRASARVAASAADRLVTRTARVLLELSESVEGTWAVHSTQAELAEWLGATREATARALATLRQAHVVTTQRSRIDIVDLAALAGWARPS